MKKIEEMTIEELIAKGDYYAKMAEQELISGFSTASLLRLLRWQACITVEHCWLDLLPKINRAII